MEYKYDLKKLPKSQLEIIVTIKHDDLQTFLTKAAETISQNVKIDGFRPGKVPYDVLKAKVGEMKIYEEAAAMAVEKSYIEIAQKEKFEPLGSPSVDFQKLAPANDFTYKAVVNLIPEIKLADIKTVKVKEKEIKVTDTDINKILEEVRNQKATETLEKKAIEQGDRAELDFDVFRDNVAIDGGSSKKYPLVIGSDHFIPGFEEQLIGLKTDEEKEFELTFPEKYHNKTLAGNPAKFKVKILAVYKRNLPELNDAFAKELGLDSMAKLKEQVKHNVEHEEHHKEEERVEVEMLEKLIEKSTFGEIPDVLVTAEVNKMLQELESNVSMQGLKFNDYLKHLNKTTEQMKLEFVPQAVKRVKGALLTRAVFFQEKIEIPESEVDREIEAAGQMYQQYPDMLKNLQTPQYREYIRNMIGNRKVMDFLKTTCVERTNPEHKC